MPRSALVIHDNPVAQRSIGVTLSRAGFEATVAADHLAAIKAFGETQFDLIIVKTDLPEFDGRRLTVALRRPGGPNADTPVLGLTTDLSQAFARECWRSGLNGLLVPPGGESALRAAIRPLGFEHLAPPQPTPVPVPIPTDDATSHALFKALGDRRLDLFLSMAEAGELTASGVAVKASISRPLFLYHIKQLVGVGLVERREQGKEVFFVAKPQRLAQVAQWLLNLAARLSA